MCIRDSVNVHTDSNGCLMGGSGGHTDAAAGAKLTMILAPLVRARLPIVTDRVTCISTPGSSIDVLVTQRGIAVNPLRDVYKRQARAPSYPPGEGRTLPHWYNYTKGKRALLRCTRIPDGENPRNISCKSWEMMAYWQYRN